MITLYGISNCDTMRKSGKWLDAQGLVWTLHDYRKHGIDAALATSLLQAFAPEQLINRRGTTWRSLGAEDQARAAAPAAASELIRQYPALIKRPIAHTDNNQWLIGLDQLQSLPDPLHT